MQATTEQFNRVTAEPADALATWAAILAALEAARASGTAQYLRVDLG